GTTYQAQVRIFSNDPVNPSIIVPVTLYAKQPSALEQPGELPRQLALFANYPNPFNPETVIAFDLPEMLPVRLEIFNVLGQSVNILINRQLGPGNYRFTWKGDNQQGKPLSSGIYLYRLTAGKQTLVRKMLLAR
ncbi:MAG: T9SS type A sorting domain-containing protein, partial [Calditrichia bacterium]